MIFRIDCYRFALSNPVVDVCMVGVKSAKQMRQSLEVLGKEPLTGK